jgi:hypothetical protein
MLVYRNGLLQLPDHEYSVFDGEIRFNHALQLGDRIHVQDGVYQQTFSSDGRTNVFVVDTEVQENLAITTLLENCLKYKDNPMVIDALERLQVALSLVRE